MKPHGLNLGALLIILTGCTQTREQIEPVSYEVPEIFRTKEQKQSDVALLFPSLSEQPDFSGLEVVSISDKESEKENESGQIELVASEVIDAYEFEGVPAMFQKQPERRWYTIFVPFEKFREPPDFSHIDVVAVGLEKADTPESSAAPTLRINGAF